MQALEDHLVQRDFSTVRCSKNLKDDRQVACARVDCGVDEVQFERVMFEVFSSK